MILLSKYLKFHVEPLSSQHNSIKCNLAAKKHKLFQKMWFLFLAVDFSFCVSGPSWAQLGHDKCALAQQFQIFVTKKRQTSEFSNIPSQMFKIKTGLMT